MRHLLIILILLAAMIIQSGCKNYGVGYNSSMDWIDRRVNDCFEWSREQRLKRLMKEQEKIEEKWLEEIRNEAEKSQ